MVGQKKRLRGFIQTTLTANQEPTAYLEQVLVFELFS
jgi:hypothetical protein